MGLCNVLARLCWVVAFCNCWLFISKNKQKSVGDAQQKAASPTGARLKEKLASLKCYLAT